MYDNALKEQKNYDFILLLFQGHYMGRTFPLSDCRRHASIACKGYYTTCET